MAPKLAVALGLATRTGRFHAFLFIHGLGIGQELQAVNMNFESAAPHGRTEALEDTATPEVTAVRLITPPAACSGGSEAELFNAELLSLNCFC